MNYLPTLTELDLSRVVGIYDVCAAFQRLGPSLKRLTVDSLTLCLGFFAIVVSYSDLQYLIMSRCDISNMALDYFMKGGPVPRRVAGCNTSSRTFETGAGTVMPSLTDLNFTHQREVDIHKLHRLRLDRVPANMASVAPDPVRMRPHPIHIDLEGCSKMHPVHLAHLQHHFPGTRTTPPVAAFFTFNCGTSSCQLPVERLWRAPGVLMNVFCSVAGEKAGSGVKAGRGVGRGPLISSELV